MSAAGGRFVQRYNYRKSMRARPNPCRLYSLGDEAGTVMFAWPDGTDKPAIPVPYAEETMSGFEYQAASYALLHAFSGFRFDMVRQAMGFRPARRIKGRFRCFWSLGTAWGEIDIGPKETALRVRYGELSLRSLSVPGVDGQDGITVTLKGRRIACRQTGESIVFGKAISLPAGATLRIKRTRGRSKRCHGS